MGSFWQSKVKIRPTDRLFSNYIKARDKGLCRVNFRCHRGSPGSDASHFYGRRKETVRFDPDNVDLVCRSCHLFIHTSLGALMLDEWKRKQLGDERYKALMIRAHLTGKRDDFLTKLYVKQLINDLKKET